MRSEILKAIARLRDQTYNACLGEPVPLALEHPALRVLRDEVDRCGSDRICPATGPLVPLYWEDRAARLRLQYLVAHVCAQVTRGAPPMSDATADALRESLRDLRSCDEAWRATCDVVERAREADEAARAAYARAHQPTILREVLEAPTTYGFNLGGYPTFGHNAPRATGDRCAECEEPTYGVLGLVDEDGLPWCLDCLVRDAQHLETNLDARALGAVLCGVLPVPCTGCGGSGQTAIPYPLGGEARVVCVGCAGRGLAPAVQLGYAEGAWR